MLPATRMIKAAEISTIMVHINMSVPLSQNSFVYWVPLIDSGFDEPAAKAVTMLITVSDNAAIEMRVSDMLFVVSVILFQCFFYMIIENTVAEPVMRIRANTKAMTISLSIGA